MFLVLFSRVYRPVLIAEITVVLVFMNSICNSKTVSAYLQKQFCMVFSQQFLKICKVPCSEEGFVRPGLARLGKLCRNSIVLHLLILNLFLAQTFIYFK